MSDSWIRQLVEPQKPTDIPIRPLRGMRRDLESNVIPVGRFFSVQNMLARVNGLERRPAVVDYMSGAVVMTFPPVRSLSTLWLLDGTQYTNIIDAKMLYYLSGVSNLVKHTYTTGTVTCTIVGGVTRATGAGGTLWATAASDLKVGDIFYSASLTGTRKWGVIKAINSDTQLDLETDEGTASAGSSYEIRRAITTNAGLFPQTLSLNGELLIVDGRREVRSFDPDASTTAFGYFSTDATYDLYPHCLTLFKDRLFFGRTVENGGTEDNRQRVRWTTTLDHTVLPALQFVDKPETGGFIRRLVNFENTLMLYMSDALWIGRMTNFGDQLPVAFDTRLETGGVGLVGDRAVLPYLGGHFMVLDDNIYFLNPSNYSLEAIGDPIRSLFFSDPDGLWSTQIEADPARDRLLFTQPSVSGGFSRIFSFDYRTKEWTFEENPGSFLGRARITQALTYDTWLSGAPYTYDTGLGIFPSYDAMGSPELPRVYVGYDDTLRYYGDATVLADSAPTGNVEIILESGDFDYGSLDDERIHLRLSVKLREAVSANVTIDVFVSTDEGSNWKQVSGRPLIIETGELENYVNFRARGSVFRYKLVCSSQAPVYAFKEIVLRVVGAGVEAHLASNR